MILFADNDILIKLFGCHLLDDFVSCLDTNACDVYITPAARYSIPKHAKKMISDTDTYQSLLDLLSTFSVVQAQDEHKLAHLSSFDGLDTGENMLILATQAHATATLITGDKRCLTALLKHKNDIIIGDIVDDISGRVYCFEWALLHLIDVLGFDMVKQKVLNRCVQDGMLQAVFRNHSNESNVIQELISYSQELSYMLVAIK